MDRLANFLERRRLLVLGAWVALLLVAAPFAAKQTEHLTAGGFQVPGSQSATVDRNLDRLWLLDKAVINVAPEGESGAMQVTAGFAGYSRAERYMRFERGARLERQGQVMEADTSTIFLLKDRDEPENVELRGNSRITGGGGNSSLQAMKAQDITLHYGPDGRTLEQALLIGQSEVQLAQPDGSPGQQLQASTIDTSLAPDGALTRWRTNSRNCSGVSERGKISLRRSIASASP